MVKKKLAVLGLAAVMTVAFMPAMAFADATGTASNTSANAAQTTSTVKDLAQGGALNSGSYKLTKDLTTEITVAAGQEVTLDLNGHNINVTSGDAIVNSGTLTIKGSGTVSAQKAAIGNTPNATCIVDGGSYNSTGWYTIKNLGTMTISNGVTVDSKKNPSKSSLIDNGYAGNETDDTLNGTHYNEDSSKNVTLTINGGNFSNNKSSIDVIKNDDYGNLTINGGSFNALHGEVLLNWNNAKINAGTFTGVNLILNEGLVSDANVCKLTITGGSFQTDGVVIGSDPDRLTGKGSVSISGGNFLTDINTAKTKITSTIAVTGGSFHNDVSTLTDGNVATATVTNGTSTTYAVGQDAIAKAAEDSSNTVTVTKGSVSLTGANAKIVNDNGTVTVDGTTVKAGDSVQPNATQTIANLKSEIASLKSQLAQAQASASSAQNTSNDSARQITQLKKDLADAQAQLKTA